MFILVIIIVSIFMLSCLAYILFGPNGDLRSMQAKSCEKVRILEKTCAYVTYSGNSVKYFVKIQDDLVEVKPMGRQ